MADATYGEWCATGSQEVCHASQVRFLGGRKPSHTIFARTPPSRVWVFSERITFYPAGAERKGSGTTAYAWFVWDKDAPSGLKPGYKTSYS
jgi:hypothetical protein